MSHADCHALELRADHGKASMWHCASWHYATREQPNYHVLQNEEICDKEHALPHEALQPAVITLQHKDLKYNASLHGQPMQLIPQLYSCSI